MNTNKGTIGAILVVAGCILLAQPSMPHPIFVYAILLNITGILLVIARLLPGFIGKAKTFSYRIKDEIKRQNSQSLKTDEKLPVGSIQHLEGADLQEANQVRWETLLKACIKSLGKTQTDVKSDKKAAPWKVMIVCFMKTHLSVSNV